jgi:sugar lactone lactonase YvrE
MSKVADRITTSNGLAWSPDARTMYWADTKAHAVFAFDFERAGGALSNRRVFVQFPPKVEGQGLGGYGGRPDGAAVDCEGHYWVAMFEGARVLRIAPDGSVSREVPLPVRSPTMPCFGGAELKTLYITTARENRPADELAREPLAGCVLQMHVDVPGLPANLARL